MNRYDFELIASWIPERARVLDLGCGDGVLLAGLSATHSVNGYGVEIDAAGVAEMLRVGREGIVTFPNFGYWRHRLDILQGRMPVSKTLPYQWYDTPNIHLCTVKDFEGLCAKLGAEILDERVINDSGPVHFLPNLMGSVGVF